MCYYKGYTFEYHYKFKKEYNKILNKHQCPTIKEDFQLLYDTLIQNFNESNKFPKHLCVHIAGLDNYVNIPAFIIKNFRCKGINKGSRSGFRITFLFDEKNKKFIFVELFNKNKKEIPNKNRINNLFKHRIAIYNELYSGEEYFLNNSF